MGPHECHHEATLDPALGHPPGWRECSSTWPVSVQLQAHQNNLFTCHWHWLTLPSLKCQYACESRAATSSVEWSQ